MISFLGQVCPMADRTVSATHASALYAGIRMETSGFNDVVPVGFGEEFD
jgi:hypothetical protein